MAKDEGDGNGRGYDWGQFHGYEVPHYTQVPDLLFDEQLPELGHAELKVLLWIIRKTFGYGKTSDAISLSQLEAGTGLGISSVKRAVRDLEAKSVIVVKRDLSKLGDSAVNTYALRLAEGGRPIVGLPSAHKEPHKKQPHKKQTTEQQQQQRAKPDGPLDQGLPAARRTAVVVASSADDQANGEALALADRLAALGVARSTTGKLLREHGPEVVGRWIAYTEHRLRSGWTPNETPAAWLVSAIRAGDWIIPEWFKTPEEQAAAREAEDQAAAERGRLQDEAAARDREEAAAQRLAFEDGLGVDDEARRLWQQTRDLLEARGEGSIALAATYLLPVTSDVATLATPVAFFCDRLADRAEAIRAALQEASGRPVREVKIELVKPEVTP